MLQVGDLCGSVLGGRYRVLTLLGRSMGSVYTAQDLTSDKPVVIKTAETTEEMARLVSEREALIRLSHPGIVRCLDFWSEPERVVLVLERLEGRSLLEEMEASPGLPPERTLVRWGAEIARILVYLHAQNPPVIHRDLKPQHVFLGPDGSLRLLDFGIARIRKGESRDTEHLGTPGYAAPEQYGLLGHESDERTDVYGLGATLFHLATGRSLDPQTVPMVREYRPELSARFAQVVDRALCREPEKRYPSVRAMLEDLEACRFRVLPEWKAWAVGSAVTGLTAWWGTGMMASGLGVEGPVTAVLLGGIAAGGFLALRGRGPLSRAVGATLLASGAVTLLASLNPDVPAALAAWFRRLGLEAAPLMLRVPALGWIGLALWAGWMVRLGGLWRQGDRWASRAFLVMAALLAAGFAWAQAGFQVRDTRPIVAQQVAAGQAQWELPSRPMSRVEPILGKGGEVDLRCGFLVTDELTVEVFQLRTGEPLWKRSLTDPMNLLLTPGQFVFLDGLNLEGVDVETGETRVRVVLDEPYRYVMPANLHTFVAASVSGERWEARDWPSGRLKWARPAEGLLRHAWEAHALADRGQGRLSLVDLETGRNVWSLDAGPGSYRVLPGQDLLLWFGPDDIRAYARADGRQVYRLDRLVPASADPKDLKIRALPDRVIVAAGSRVVSFEPTGGRVGWSADLGLERVAEVFTFPGLLQVQCRSGRMLGLSAQDGSLVWEHWPRDVAGGRLDPADLGGRSLPLFPVEDRALYQVPGSSEAVVLDLRTGAVQARLPLGEGVQLRAARAVPGRLLLGLATSDGQGTLRSLPLPVRHSGGAEGSELTVLP